MYVNSDIRIILYEYLKIGMEQGDIIDLDIARAKILCKARHITESVSFEILTILQWSLLIDRPLL